MRSFALDQTSPPTAQAGFLGYLTALLIAAGLVFTWAGLCAL
jgi:hypothetical protein